MVALLVLATALVAGTPQAGGLPALSDVARAHTDLANEFCRVTIDLCAEVDWWSPPATAAGDIKHLRCRPTGRSTATCTFDVANEKCTGRFARSDNGKDASWDLRRDRKAGFSLMMRCRPLS